MTAPRPALLLALGTSLLAAAGIGATGAAFTASSANPGNGLVASSSFGFRVASGTYTGNATAGRAITGLGFAPDLVIVKANTAQVAMARTATMSGDATKPLAGAAASQTGRITALTTDGFTLGANAQVNATGTAYHWVAMARRTGVMRVGSYTGNGTTTQAVTGLGFAPSLVAVLPESTANATFRGTGMSNGTRFDADAGAAGRIASLDAEGFTAGSQLNAAGTVFHYVAFQNTAGAVTSGTYAGDGRNSRTLTGFGFQPGFAFLHATTAARAGVERPAALAGNASGRFGAAANDTDAITGLVADGLDLGRNADVNTNGTTYFYAGFRDQGP